MCCDGTAIRGRVHGERTACCGSTVYNDDDQVCCYGDTLRPRVHGAAVDCCETDELMDGHNCCMMDTANGTVTAYDASTHLCCDGVIQERATSNSLCCGNAVYDAATHVCCNDTAIGTTCCGSSAIGGPSAEDRKCCGESEVYDATSEICCDDVVRRKVFGDATACCGTAGYDTVSAQCCDGAVHFAANELFRC